MICDLLINDNRLAFGNKIKYILVTCEFCIKTGGLAEEVDLEVVKAAFIPFGDINDVQMPLDYESQKHRGFAFVEFEMVEDAAAAIDNMVKFESFLTYLTQN